MEAEAAVCRLAKGTLAILQNSSRLRTALTLGQAFYTDRTSLCAIKELLGYSTLVVVATVLATATLHGFSRELVYRSASACVAWMPNTPLVMVPRRSHSCNTRIPDCRQRLSSWSAHLKRSVEHHGRK